MATLKRSLPVDTVNDGPPTANKKARGESDKILGKSTADPPETLTLSVLTWLGEPTTYDRDGNPMDEYVGEYRSAHTSTWSLNGWDETHQAFRYTPFPPSRTPKFTYSREAYTDTIDIHTTYYGGLIAYEMSPLARIGLPNDDLWPETWGHPWVKDDLADESIENGDESQGEEGARPGPPFRFYECDTPTPDGIPYEFFTRDTVLCVNQPDLPGQVGASAAETEPEEEDSVRVLGWRGPWVDALFKLSESGMPLGERTRTYRDLGGLWEAVMKLKTLKIYKVDFYDEGGDEDELEKKLDANDLRKYDVEATVEEIFVKPEWVHR